MATSSPTSTYRFLPWARRGLSDKIKVPDTGAPLAARATVAVGITVTGSPEATYNLSVYGPGDVIGVDTTMIVRTDPRPNATDVESNFFAAIEFDAPDFPWLFTPAMSSANNRLRPWCVLIVVDLSVVQPPAGQAGHPLPVLVIPGDVRATELPDLAESWAWAHTQMVVPSTSTASNVLTAAIAAEPAMNVARIVAPRRLEPNKRYAACLVPAFDAGVARGLLGTAPTVDTLGPAWAPTGDQPVTLPVYFHWEFSTGPAGDFETLARRLKPFEAPAAAGIESMYIGAASPELPAIAPTDPTSNLDMDGPLRALKRSNGTLSEVPATIQAGLEQTLNSTGDQAQFGTNAPASVLGPPIYGGWQANQHTVPPSTGWLRELNLDPRTRAAAGLGSEIERRSQEDFMQWAWEQVGDVVKANALLSRSRLSMETLIRIHTRHVATLPIDRALQFSAPLHRRVTQGAAQTGVTVRAAIEQSSLPDASTDPALRRLISPMSRTLQAAARHATGGGGTVPGAAPRPVGTLAGVSATTARTAATAKVDTSKVANLNTAGMTTAVGGTMPPAPAATGFVGKLASGQLNVDPTRFVPDGIAGVPDLGASTTAPAAQMSLASIGLPITIAQTSFVAAQNASLGIAAVVRPMIPSTSAIVSAIGSLKSTTAAPGGMTVATSVVIDTSTLATTKSVDAGVIRTNTGLKSTIASKEAMKGATKAAAAPPIAPIVAPPIKTQPIGTPPVVAQPIDIEPIIVQPINTPPVTTQPAPPGPQFVAFALATARDAVLSRTNPRATVFARVQTMLTAGATPLTLQPTNTGIVPPKIGDTGISVAPTLDRIMVAPEIDVPVYRYLADLDPSRFMPGVGDVPNDSAMLLETNPRFIEALLVGLNHEMNRELLWREYPTDQRGTPFRHFWGWSDGGADIQAINTWTPTNALGANSRSGAGGQIVLLVRGRLLKRYPNTSIYAWRSSGGKLVNPPTATDLRTPVFTGVLGSDIAFAGFDLTDTDLNTGDGWFFVLQQQPTEPRFGFDEGTGAPQATLKSWSDANWDDTGTAPGQYLKITSNRLSGTKIGTASFVDHAAHLAYITIQKPVAVALHSRTLVPSTTT
jgi:hypothetical protein